MARRRIPLTPPPKRHHTERYRGNFITRWSVAKGAYVGFYTGLGYSSGDIEKHMADGTSRDTVRRLWKLWRLPLEELGDRSRASIMVSLTHHQRAKLTRQAKKRGLTREEYIRRIIVCAVADDMFDAIVDREFE